LALSADPGGARLPAAPAQPPLAAGRRLRVVAAAAAALLALAAALAIALFDINRYKPEIEAAVRTHSGRRLHLNGDLALSFFPRLAIDLPASSLSARDSEAEFLSFSSARIEVALLPLLWQEVVIESMQLREARATMTLPGKHGSAGEVDSGTSAGDAATVPSPAAAARSTAQTPAVPDSGAAASRESRWEIRQLLLSDTALILHNAVNGKTIVLSAINLETGRLAAKTQLPLALKAQVAVMNQPEVLGEIEVTASVDIDMTGARPVLAASDFKLGFTGRRDSQPWRAALTASRLSRQGETFSAAQVAVSLQPDGEPAADAWTFAASAEEITFDGQRLSLPHFDGEIAREDPRLPGGQARLPLSGALTLDARHERASLQLAAKASDARFEASIELTNFAQPEVGFDLQADRLNLDAYLPLAQPLAGKAAAGAKPAANAPAASSEPGQTQPRSTAAHLLRTAASAPTLRPASASAAAEPAFDLAGLHKLRLDGQLQIAQLQAGGIKAAAVHAGVHSADGRAILAPLSAHLYGGQADGDLTLDAQGAPDAQNTQGPRVSMKLALNDVDFGALARDALGRSDLEGRGNVDLALSSSGQSRAELTRAAQGTARFALREVALVGIDLADVLDQVKDILNAGGSQSGRIDTSRLTRLSHLSATVKLAEGMARNDDLDGAAPKLALGGYGQFDLLSSELDYTLRVMMAANPAESSKLLRALEGLPIPVHISGPAEELRYSISLTDVAADALRRHSDDIGAALVDEAERFFDRLFGGKKK
jgi:AsmA protein